MYGLYGLALSDPHETMHAVHTDADPGLLLVYSPTGGTAVTKLNHLNACTYLPIYLNQIM